MNMVPVESSTIASIGHDPATNKLHVAFKGKNETTGPTWEYDDVTADDHSALIGADSIGSHFHANVKKRCTARQIA